MSVRNQLWITHRFKKHGLVREDGFPPQADLERAPAWRSAARTLQGWKCCFQFLDSSSGQGVNNVGDIQHVDRNHWMAYLQ